MGSEVAAANARANALLKSSRAGEALALLEAALKANPQLGPSAKSTLLANKGLCLEQVGRLDEAVDALRAAVQAKPENTAATGILRQLEASQVLNLALRAAEKDDFARALQLFQKAGATDPEGDGVWRYNTSVMLNKLGRYPEALAELEAYVDSIADDADEASKLACLPLHGELLCKAQRWSQAEAVIHEAWSRGLELPASLMYNYGVALLKCQETPRAREAFNEVIAYYPNYGLAYDAVASIDALEGAALCQQGDFKQAIPKLYASGRRTPKIATLYNLALALLKETRAVEAAEQFAAVLRLDPEHDSAIAGLEAAELMLDTGNFADQPTEAAEALLDGRPTAQLAPTRRIYQICHDKGIGTLAREDDMVQFLSGIEDWVETTLGPMENRILILEKKRKTEEGVVRPTTKDDTKQELQQLLQRVTLLEQCSSTASADTETEGLMAFQQTSEGLDARIKCCERLLLGDDKKQDVTLIARLSDQDQRLAEMTAQFEANSQRIEAMQRQLEELSSPVSERSRGRGGQRRAGMCMDGPTMIGELTAATNRRAVKRCELGLAMD